MQKHYRTSELQHGQFEEECRQLRPALTCYLVPLQHPWLSVTKHSQKASLTFSREKCPAERPRLIALDTYAHTFRKKEPGNVHPHGQAAGLTFIRFQLEIHADAYRTQYACVHVCKLKMITTALSKMEASEAVQHSADIGERGTYGEFHYKMRCPLFE